MRAFEKELLSLERLDAKNQRELAGQRSQLVLLTEGVFFRAFRAYENFLEDVFLLYVMEKPTLKGNVTNSYLKALDFSHARELVMSGKQVLDWTNPEAVMERADTYIEKGGTVRSSIASAKQSLQDMKVVRNHIAHNSVESERKFLKVLRRVRGTAPINKVLPGDHLLSNVRGASPSTYYLSHYISLLKDVSESIAEKA